MLYCIICIIGAYVVVNIYNILVGGTWIEIKTFIYPIASEEYDMFSTLRTSLPSLPSGYICYIILYVYTLFQATCELCLNPQINRRQSIVCLCIAVSGLGALTYYVNRAVVVCLVISNIQFVLLVAMYGERCVNSTKKMLHNVDKIFLNFLSLLAFIIIVSMATEGIAGTGSAIKNRVESVWNIDSLEKSIELYEQNVPKDTMAFGYGMPELYYQMGWKNSITITDWADMNHFSIEELEKSIQDVDSFVQEKNSQSKWLPDSSFKAVKTIVTEDFECVYYERVKEINNE